MQVHFLQEAIPAPCTRHISYPFSLAENLDKMQKGKEQQKYLAASFGLGLIQFNHTADNGFEHHGCMHIHA
jgi:hypothetical protein